MNAASIRKRDPLRAAVVAARAFVEAVFGKLMAHRRRFDGLRSRANQIGIALRAEVRPRPALHFLFEPRHARLQRIDLFARPANVLRPAEKPLEEFPHE